MTTKLDFATELQNWRHALHLTQSAACERLDVSLDTYRRWEQDRARPSHLGAIRLLMATKPPLERRKRRDRSLT